VVAGFWHVRRVAGVAVLASGLVGIGVHSAGYVRLELKEPGDTESLPWPDPAPRRCSSHGESSLTAVAGKRNLLALA
jgi:hypothetical protein